MTFEKTKLYQISFGGSALTATPAQYMAQTRNAMTAPKATDPRQGWMIEPVSEAEEDVVWIRSFLNSELFLTAEGYNERLSLRTWSDLDGHAWKLEPTTEGKFLLRNKLQDFENRATAHLLDPEVGTNFGLFSEGYVHQLFENDQQLENWEVNVEEVTDLAPHPVLEQGHQMWYSFAPLDTDLYIDNSKKRYGALFFVDYDDAIIARKKANIPANNMASAQALAKTLLGENDDVARSFRDQSWDSFDLEIHDMSSKGWIKLPGDTTEYLHKSTEPGKPGEKGKVKFGNVLHNNIRDALYKILDPKSQRKPSPKDQEPQFPADHVNFDGYDFLMVVQPQNMSELHPNAGLHISWARAQKNNHYINFGTNASKANFGLTIHEIGHLIGLPDLYPGSSADEERPTEFKGANIRHTVGCWSVMADTHHSRTFLGIERNHMQWMKPTRKVNATDELLELEKGSKPDDSEFGPYASYDLYPMDRDHGLSMVTISLEEGSRLLAFELGQPVYFAKDIDDGTMSYKEDTSGKEGVLVYAVDSRVKSTVQPIDIVAKKISESKDNVWGNLDEALYVDGDKRDYFDDESGIMVRFRVRRLDDGAFRVDVARYDQAKLAAKNTKLDVRSLDFYRMQDWLLRRGYVLFDGGNIYANSGAIDRTEPVASLKAKPKLDATQKPELNDALAAKISGLELHVADTVWKDDGHWADFRKEFLEI